MPVMHITGYLKIFFPTNTALSEDANELFHVPYRREQWNIIIPEREYDTYNRRSYRIIVRASPCARRIGGMGCGKERSSV
jgi:hypothetical protein